MKTSPPINNPVIITGGSGFDVAVLENPMPVLSHYIESLLLRSKN